MPFVSRSQAAWGHSPAGVKALGGPEKVKEWDAATKGAKLPKRVRKPKAASAGHVFGALAPIVDDAEE